MLANEPPITLREIEKTEPRTGPSERELLLLFGASFTVMWATIFLLHRSLWSSPTETTSLIAM